MKIVYYSNNSGGSDWLKEKDWQALEKAGWIVGWRNYTWGGREANSASLESKSLEEAIYSFEEVTGQSASAVGCQCCGPPHNFHEEKSQSLKIPSPKKEPEPLTHIKNTTKRRLLNIINE